jgi:transcriptional regulator with PAS, ATPase and Fis domain
MAVVEDRTATRREPAIHARRLCLLVVHDQHLATHPLPSTGAIVIGRSRDVDLRLDLPPISRRHIVLHLGDRISVEDCGSANGTRVRDRAVPAGTSVEVAPGDAIELGSVMLVIQRVADTGAPEVATPGSSAVMKTLDKMVERVAAGEINVLLHGETGVGKEVFAERIHAGSRRARKSLLRLNCAALTESLLESELFGHEKGAFTGATQTKPGLLETANGGTVFLDEIGDLPLPLQAKLLRVIEDKKVMRVGALEPISIDVRFVAATHKDLEAECDRGAFRRDLYFRLAGITVVIPPLRERVAEIEPLARGFLRDASERANRRGIKLSKAAIARLTSYTWPGNVRELRNAIERAVLLCETTIEPEHLPATRESRPSSGDLRAGVVEYERQRIVEALASCNGNQTKAAKLLGISRRTLIERLDELQLPRPRKK